MRGPWTSTSTLLALTLQALCWLRRGVESSKNNAIELHVPNNSPSFYTGLSCRRSAPVVRWKCPRLCVTLTRCAGAATCNRLNTYSNPLVPQFTRKALSSRSTCRDRLRCRAAPTHHPRDCLSSSVLRFQTKAPSLTTAPRCGSTSARCSTASCAPPVRSSRLQRPSHRYLPRSLGC